jgi:hypothetical protein
MSVQTLKWANAKCQAVAPSNDSATSVSILSTPPERRASQVLIVQGQRARFQRLTTIVRPGVRGIEIDPTLSRMPLCPLARIIGRQAAIVAIVCIFTCLSTTTLVAQRDVPLTERARGAEQVVVGRVSSVTSVWRDNDFGDRLITSIVHVTVDETLKGPSQPTMDVEVEGGTIGTLTLRVSDLEQFAPGDRAVFYLKHNRRGAFVPHLRGLGLQKVDGSGRVTGTSVTLDQVRRDVRAGAGRQQ